MNAFRAFLKSRLDADKPVYLDGGMGTMIQASGETGYALPEELAFTRPALITSIHAAYLEAGSDIVTTNTFGANPLKLAGSGLETEAVYREAARRARAAVEKAGGARPRFIAADIGPTGQLLEPLGKLPFDAAFDAFRAAAKAAERAGADLILIETMTDLYEMKAALLAARESTSLPVFASLAYEEDRRTLTGADPLTAVTVLESLRPDALGFNCGGSLEDADALSRAYCAAARLPVLAEPNAGLPVVENGRMAFKITPEAFAERQVSNARLGVRILGGCCGTTPAHIAAMTAAMPAALPPRPRPAPATRVSSPRRTVSIGNLPGGPGPAVIGERINPTGKKRCREALLAGDKTFLLNEAERQIAAGADILDVNVGIPGIDEAASMLSAVRSLQQTFDAPLQIDSGDPAVLERALRHVNGKPLVNSVNGKQAVMDAVFPLVRRYGGAVVALCLDERGIPPDAEGRIAIARRIIARAAEFGIGPEDILIDALTLTAASRQNEAAAALRAVARLKDEFGPRGLKTVLGISNISFGLPRRELVNAHFLSMALAAGLDAAIVNPLSNETMDAFRVYRAIAAFDKNCLNYIRHYSGTTPGTAAPNPATTGAATTGASAPNPATPGTAAPNPADPGTAAPNPAAPGAPASLRDLIVKGFADAAPAAARRLLQTAAPAEIVDRHIVPALDQVGRDYESGRIFLPQLLLSAQTVSRAFQELKAALATAPGAAAAPAAKGAVVLATVEGDIHDIGKNIAAAMLENYGYTVIDLGKDVKPDAIAARAVAEKARLVGLSALMTTTVVNMERTIRALREAEARTGLRFRVMAAGAVLTADYARRIGADFYAKDAMASVAIAREVFRDPPDKPPPPRA